MMTYVTILPTSQYQRCPLSCPSGSLDRVDQFGQAVDQIFAQGGVNVQELKDGRNVLGDVLWRADLTAVANSVSLDHLNAYDALRQLKSQAKGELNGTNTGIVGTPAESEAFNLDGMGKFANYTRTVSGSTTVDQDRGTNSLNQITSIGSSWIAPAYDAAGNMTTVPQPGNETVALTCTYDAWNELAKVYSGVTLVASYSYDGFHRRMTETADGQTRAYYVSASNQVLEERVSNSPLPLKEGRGEGGEGPGTEGFQTTAEIFAALPANRQYVWGLRYVDDLVLRDRATGGSGDLGINGSGLNERLYALQDANWNIVALVNTSGAAVERYTYTAFGTATVLNSDFSPRTGGTAYAWTNLFAGRDIDSYIGLYYNRARWYDSGLGVFTTRDPIPADINTYRYADNSPVNATDPTGFQVARFWRFDPTRGETIDVRTGLTYAQISAMEAASLAQQMAGNPGIGRVNSYSNWFQGNVPGGQLRAGTIGSGVYSIKQNVFGMSNAAIASESDTAIAVEGVTTSAVAGVGLFLGGEALLGVGTAGGGLTALFGGGTATTLAGVGGGTAGILETPEGQELLEEGEVLLSEAGGALVENVLNNTATITQYVQGSAGHVRHRGDVRWAVDVHPP
jgi:RHS repeat-associated protein